MTSTLRIVLATTLALAPACKPRDDASAVRASEEGEVKIETGAVGSFRDVLVACLTETNGAVTQKMKDFVIYQPTEAMMQAPTANAESPEALLTAMDETMKSVMPADLYEQGMATAAQPVSAEDLNASLLAKPMTIVIIPGVFGEFIETRAFDDVFSRKKSAYAKDVNGKFADFRKLQKGGDTAPSYSLHALGNVDIPLDQLLTAGSIDDEDGNALVNVLLLNTPALSLESLGNISDKAQIFAARLDQYFRIVGVPERIMLVGYSRGAPVALDMMAAPKVDDWRANVKAVVSLGGVIFGSALADSAKDPNSPAAKQLAALKTLKDSLVEKKTAFYGNSKAWYSFAKTMAKLNNPEGGTPTLEQAEAMFTNYKGVDINSTGNLMFRYYKEFGLASPLKDYVANIQRFKKLVDEVTEAVLGLNTEARLAWWRTHKLKTDGVRYYALAATMDDPTTSRLGNKLMSNPYTYDPDSYDQKFLTTSYSDYYKASGAAVNDSQVSALRTHVWPGLVERLNGQRPEGEFLGVLGTHHWGLALKVVSKMTNGKTNPFPRVELLKAVAAYEARKL